MIDVHHHWIPPHQAKDLARVALPGQTVRELRPGTMGLFRGPSMLFWCNQQISSVERLIANLERCGIEKAVISVSNWIEWLDLAMCRELNDAMHELRRRFPDRILTLAHVPIGEEGALDELERCRSMGVDGVFTIVHLSRKGWSRPSRPEHVLSMGRRGTAADRRPPSLRASGVRGEHAEGAAAALGP